MGKLSVYKGVTVARAIMDARETAGLSQDELAEQLGYATSTVAKWEKGYREPPILVFFKLMELCGSVTFEPEPVIPVLPAVEQELLDKFRKLAPERKDLIIRIVDSQICVENAVRAAKAWENTCPHCGHVGMPYDFELEDWVCPDCGYVGLVEERMEDYVVPSERR